MDILESIHQKTRSTYNLAVEKYHHLFHITVKAGNDEGFWSELLDIKIEIYFSWFTEHEIKAYFEQANFSH